MNKELLLIELKSKLSITWNDDEIDNKLNSIINNAIVTLNFKIGAEIDFSTPGIEQTYFLNYCMYSYNNCLNEFDKNYLSEFMLIKAKSQSKILRRLNEKT